MVSQKPRYNGEDHPALRDAVDPPVRSLCGKPENLDTTYLKVFVANLPWAAKSGDIYNYFRKFGEIIEAAVIYSHSGARPKSRGYGFVVFREPTGAKNALEDPHPKWNGR